MSPRKKARMENNSNQACVNWAELNPKLLCTIAKKLCDISNFKVFRAVCKAWRNATDISNPPPQFPCLINWPMPNLKARLRIPCRIYSPASHRTHTFEVSKTTFYGPAGHNMLIRSRSDRHLYYLNPLTGARKRIPYEEPNYYTDPANVGFSSRIEEFVMVKYRECYDAFYFKRSEQDEWTTMTFDHLISAAYYKNQYFLLENHNVENRILRIVVIDENDKPKLSSIPFPSEGFDLNYLITTTDSLLAVSATIPSYRTDMKNSEFEVHRLDNYPQNPHWTKLSGIGDVMLFLDHYSCFSLNASDYGSFTGSCIYFITRIKRPQPEHEIGRCPQLTEHMIGRFDMELNKVEELSGPAWFRKWNSAMRAAWFVPSM